MDQQVTGSVIEQVARKLVTIRRIDAIDPIEGADAIEVATVGGWKVVVKKGEFEVGKMAAYFEIDSWVPHKIAPFLSRGHEPRTYNNVPGERLRTIKLRGQVSQGLLLPLVYVGAQFAGGGYYYVGEQSEPIGEGEIEDDGKLIEFADLTEYLGVQKWERQLSAQLAGKARGNFPSFIRKTDQERIQNLTREFEKAVENGDRFEVTHKLDGSSMTVYSRFNCETDEWEYGVCSRNLNLKLDQEGNAFVDTAKKSGLLDALQKLNHNIAVQGELCGPNIQGNSEGLSDFHFYLFDVYSIDGQRYLSPAERYAIYQELRAAGANVSHVPIMEDGITLAGTTVAEILQFAEGKNAAGNEREGLVFKRLDGLFSFKAISNRFLLKGGD